MSALGLKIACEPDEKTEKMELLEFGKEYGLIGECPVFLGFLKELKAFSAFSHTVLLEGETGTGKELAARALNNRKEGLFVPVNCGSLEGEMGHVELVGYKGKSFTGGAREDRPGLFFQATNGTIFLDEVQLLENAMQKKLLRILENKTLLPIGDTAEIPIPNVRVVAASNENLSSLVEQKAFRQDLYYRLCILVIHVPPLRERKEDIPLLAQHFIEKHREEFHSFVECISDEALSVLMEYSWPGNVRELKHMLMRVLARQESGIRIKENDLPPLAQAAANINEEMSNDQDPFSFQHRFEQFPTFIEGIMTIERLLIQRALELTNQNARKAANLLDIGLATINRKRAQHILRDRKRKK